MRTLLIISHEVKNFPEWKKGFDAGESLREQAGVKPLGIFTSPDNENLVTIISDVPDADVARALSRNAGLRAAMEKAGVVSEPQVTIINQVN